MERNFIKKVEKTNFHKETNVTKVWKKKNEDGGKNVSLFT